MDTVRRVLVGWLVAGECRMIVHRRECAAIDMACAVYRECDGEQRSKVYFAMSSPTAVDREEGE